MTKIKKITNVSRKFIGTPITNEEKFEKMRLKNPALGKLKEVFSLEIEI